MPAAGGAGAAAARPLLAALQQQAARFAADGLPLTGVVGAPGLHLLLDPGAALQELFGEEGAAAGAGGAPPDLDGAFAALRMLPRQHEVLSGCEEETRAALRQWSDFQQTWQQRVRDSAAAAAPVSPTPAAARAAAAGALQPAAAESAAWLLYRMGREPAIQSLLLDEEVEEQRREVEEGIAGAARALDEMAERIRTEGGGALFPAQGAASTGGGGPEPQRQLEAIGKAMFSGPERLKYEPMEWVYDGLAPIMLPDVLARRKGAPLALALAAAGAARRLGVRGVRLVCARDAEVLTTAEGPAHMQNMPPEVAARQAGRVTAAPPSPNTWLVAAATDGGGGGGGAPGALLDVTRRGSEVLDLAAARARYPAMHAPAWGGPHGGGGGGGAHGDGGGAHGDAGGACIVGVWSEMAQTMVMAHQRRGESDLVAAWMYQSLALDTRAPEWAHALGDGG